VPATVFVVASGVDESNPFWWDELAALCLQSTRGCDLVLTFGEADVRLHWSSNQPAKLGWRATEPPPGPRERAFLALYTLLQRSDAATRASAMQQLRTVLGPVVLPGSRSMNSQELARHLDGDCIRPGGHSSTHPALSHLPADDARREIEVSAADLKQRFGERQYGFAYPYGDMNAAVMRMVREAGFAYACSTRHGGVDVERANLFALPRIAVGNWRPSDLQRVMSNA
jgi:peptidoglycan/xylan/chitin deacetylase (PgdA/CDA1 family)